MSAFASVIVTYHLRLNLYSCPIRVRSFRSIRDPVRRSCSVSTRGEHGFLVVVINHEHSLARREYIKGHGALARFLDVKYNMRSVVLACEHACAGACPDRRRVAWHPSRTSAVMTGARDEEEKKGAHRLSREREREVMLAVGSKTQKNSVACRGTESTPKIHSLAPFSRARKVARDSRNAALDTRDDVAANRESISDSSL